MRPIGTDITAANRKFDDPFSLSHESIFRY